jgi:hypothetical protein
MVAVTVLVAALAVGAAAQGGYYPAGRVAVLALVVLAGLLAKSAAPVSTGPAADRGAGGDPARDGGSTLPLVLACGALAAWAVARGVAAGATPAGLAAAGTLVTVAVPVLLLARSGDAQRRRCVTGLAAVGTAVAVTAWIGVAWRYQPFVQLVEHRLWRGSSTITYPNATAALLAPIALLVLGELVGRRPAPGRTAVAYALLVGLGATLSRAGLIGLAAGLVVLCAAAGVRVTVVRVLPVLLGAGLAGTALAPSAPAGGPPHPALAGAGLLAGLLVAVAPQLPDRLLPASRRRRALLSIPAFLLVAAAIGLALHAAGAALDTVLASRGTLASSGRSGALHAAWQLVGAYPVAGTGVGQARFLWPDGTGNLQVARYAHNEYLQLLVDLGAVGAALLLVLLGSLARTAWRGRPGTRRPGRWAGAVAAVTALAVHSGFDFLWHLAVLPLLAGLLIGLASRVPEEECTTTIPPRPQSRSNEQEEYTS